MFKLGKMGSIVENAQKIEKHHLGVFGELIFSKLGHSPYISVEFNTEKV